jgi:hypothetical protein
MTTPDGPDRPPITEPDEDENDPGDDEAVAPPPAPTSRFSSVSVDRYLPVIAIIAMVATYLQVAPYFALTFIALVWLLATRVTKNHRFLGLSLTEGLAWAATCLIFLFLAALALGATQTPV